MKLVHKLFAIGVLALSVQQISFGYEVYNEGKDPIDIHVRKIPSVAKKGKMDWFYNKSIEDDLAHHWGIKGGKSAGWYQNDKKLNKYEELYFWFRPTSQRGQNIMSPNYKISKRAAIFVKHAEDGTETVTRCLENPNQKGDWSLCAPVDKLVTNPNKDYYDYYEANTGVPNAVEVFNLAFGAFNKMLSRLSKESEQERACRQVLSPLALGQKYYNAQTDGCQTEKALTSGCPEGSAYADFGGVRVLHCNSEAKAFECANALSSTYFNYNGKGYWNSTTNECQTPTALDGCPDGSEYAEVNGVKVLRCKGE